MNGVTSITDLGVGQSTVVPSPWYDKLRDDIRAVDHVEYRPRINRLKC